jgi:hypothetical protein
MLILLVQHGMENAQIKGRGGFGKRQTDLA